MKTLILTAALLLSSCNMNESGLDSSMLTEDRTNEAITKCNNQGLYATTHRAITSFGEVITVRCISEEEVRERDLLVRGSEGFSL